MKKILFLLLVSAGCKTTGKSDFNYIVFGGDTVITKGAVDLTKTHSQNHGFLDTVNGVYMVVIGEKPKLETKMSNTIHYLVKNRDYYFLADKYKTLFELTGKEEYGLLLNKYGDSCNIYRDSLMNH